MAASLQTFLDQARAGGTVDSSGKFSLDPVRARQLLGRFQLSSPAQYLLKLAQAALCARASRLSFRLGRDRTEVRFEGHEIELFDTYEVMDAFNRSTPLEDDSAMAHLTLGLNAAAAQGPLSIVWTAWSTWRQERLTIDATGVHFEKLTSSPWDNPRGGYEIVVTHPGPAPPPRRREKKLAFWQRLIDSFAPQTPVITRRAREHALLTQRLSHFPIPVDLDGRSLQNPTLSEPDKEFEQIHYSCGGPNVFQLPHGTPIRALAAWRGRWRHLDPGNWGGAVVIARPRRAQDISTATFFHYGVRLKTLELNLGQPALEILASSAGVDVDLSESGVVDNDKLRKWLDRVHRGDPPAEGLPPLLPHIDRSYLPQELRRVRVKAHQGLITHLEHEASPQLKLRLDQEFMNGSLSGTDAWPAKPPWGLTATNWSYWARGAIECVAHEGFVKITERYLKGPYVTEGDGIRAEFYPDGQLRTLACYRNDEPVGWQLILEHGLHQGRVDYCQREAWEEFSEYSRVPGAPCWAQWVTGYISAVYQDFLL